MGTSGLLAFIVGGIRLATYCHYDSYPKGLGQDILNFILELKPEQYAIMNQRLQDIKKSSLPRIFERNITNWATPSESSGDERQNQWYWVLRGVQGGPALQPILNGDLEHLVAVKIFEGQFREFSYYVDFQGMILETWMDDKMLHKARFAELAELGSSYMEKLENEYYD